MKKLVLALAVATLLVSPAIAQSTTRGKAKVVEPPLVTWPLGAFAQSPPGALMSREQAVQECNADARGWPQTTYGHQEFDRYRACITTRGHTE